MQVLLHVRMTMKILDQTLRAMALVQLILATYVGCANKGREISRPLLLGLRILLSVLLGWAEIEGGSSLTCKLCAWVYLVLCALAVASWHTHLLKRLLLLKMGS